MLYSICKYKQIFALHTKKSLKFHHFYSFWVSAWGTFHVIQHRKGMPKGMFRCVWINCILTCLFKISQINSTCDLQECGFKDWDTGEKNCDFKWLLILLVLQKKHLVFKSKSERQRYKLHWFYSTFSTWETLEFLRLFIMLPHIQKHSN